MKRIVASFTLVLAALVSMGVTLQGIYIGSDNTGLTDNAWTTFTPSLSCGTATFTVNSARGKHLGKTQFISLDFTISAIGSCTTTITFTVPTTVQSGSAMTGRETVSTGEVVQCSLASGGTTASCTGGATVNFQVNQRIMIGGVYETP